MGDRPKVFLSHTREFVDDPTAHLYLTAAQQACTSEEFDWDDMSRWTANPEPPLDVCRRRVRSSDVYVGIVGFNYGTAVATEAQQSYVELELEEAQKRGLPVLIFMLEGEKEGLTGLAGEAPEPDARQAAFRQRLSENHLVGLFNSPARLEVLLAQALHEIKNRVTPNLEGALKVFVAGSRAANGFTKALKAELDKSNRLDPLLWSRHLSSGETTLHALEKKLDLFDFAVFVVGPDDINGSVRRRRRPGSHGDVVFEYGLFTGKYSHDRTFLLTSRGVELPSDIERSRFPEHFNGAVAPDKLSKIAQLLEARMTEQGPRRGLRAFLGLPRHDDNLWLVLPQFVPDADEHVRFDVPGQRAGGRGNDKVAPLAVNDLRAQTTVAEMLGQETITGIPIVDQEASKGDAREHSAIIIGLTTNSLTRDYISLEQDPLFVSVGPKGDEVVRISSDRGIVEIPYRDDKYGIIARTTPRGVENGKRWTFVAGLGPTGTEAAANYLAKHWLELVKEVDSRDFVLVVKCVPEHPNSVDRHELYFPRN